MNVEVVEVVVEVVVEDFPLRGTPLCIFLRPQEIKIIKTRRVRRHEESDCSEESLF
jgi:hypothetical protein